MELRLFTILTILLSVKKHNTLPVDEECGNQVFDQMVFCDQSLCLGNLLWDERGVH